MARQLLSGNFLCDIELDEVSDQGDPIRSILEEVKVGQLGIVAAVDKIDTIALASGLCKQMKLDPRLLGVDIENKGGQGVHILEVAELAKDIVEDGWSWAMVTHATCIEERPGESLIEDFNKKLRNYMCLFHLKYAELI